MLGLKRHELFVGNNLPYFVRYEFIASDKVGCSGPSEPVIP